MAFTTSEQAAAQERLSDEYGRPDVVRLEDTDEPYGILWLNWRYSVGPPRNLFVRPDGTRLAWSSLDGTRLPWSSL